jgi:hypothetical protein
MSGAAALKILSRNAVLFQDDDEEDHRAVVSRRDRNCWSPKVTGGIRSAIKPSFSSPMEAKAVRPSAAKRPYSDSLAKVFFGGAVLFVIGMIIVIVFLKLREKEIEVAGWAVAAVGATVSALSLVRAQDMNSPIFTTCSSKHLTIDKIC